jgi:AMP phosphorylase
MEVLSPVEFSSQEVKEITEKVGGALVWGGATNIAPADDKLIRVSTLSPLTPITRMLASIMAKGAIGADNVVMDFLIGPARSFPMFRKAELARDLINLGTAWNEC